MNNDSTKMTKFDCIFWGAVALGMPFAGVIATIFAIAGAGR